MKRPFPFATRQSQEGAVAVEAALCMAFVLVPLLFFILLFGKFFWYYTAAQKAIHDATLYMASAPLSEVRSRHAEQLARDIMTQETEDFDLATTTEPSIDCGYKSGSTIRFRDCLTTGTPVAMQATIMLTVPHPFFLPISNTATLSDSISIFIGSEMPYVGR
jgi:hypothetical protein